MGLAGAAIAFTLSQATNALLLLCYTVCRDACKAAARAEDATWCRPGRAMFAGARGAVLVQLQAVVAAVAGCVCACVCACRGGSAGLVATLLTVWRRHHALQVGAHT
jgi:hypothetical protein